jgi:hypothetical protein
MTKKRSKGKRGLLRLANLLSMLFGLVLALMCTYSLVPNMWDGLGLRLCK